MCKDHWSPSSSHSSSRSSHRQQVESQSRLDTTRYSRRLPSSDHWARPQFLIFISHHCHYHCFARNSRKRPLDTPRVSHLHYIRKNRHHETDWLDWQKIWTKTSNTNPSIQTTNNNKKQTTNTNEWDQRNVTYHLLIGEACRKILTTICF